MRQTAKSPHQAHGQPISGDTITKVVRQHFVTPLPEPYLVHTIQLRTDKNCQKGKPEDYWPNNYSRRCDNLHKGFHSVITEPYKPLGGEITTDPVELVLSAMPDVMDTKTKMRIRRFTHGRGDEETPTDVQSEHGSSRADSDEVIKLCPSGGLNGIKQQLRETENNIVNVLSGKPFLENLDSYVERKSWRHPSHKPETEMVVISLSASSSEYSLDSDESDEELEVALTPTTSSDSRRESLSRKHRSSLLARLSQNRVESRASRVGSLKAGMSLTGSETSKRTKMPSNKEKKEAHAAQRRERIIKDQQQYLSSVYDYLTVLHNLRYRDLRSKHPLSREVIERLKLVFKEEDRLSRGLYSILPRIGTMNRGGLKDSSFLMDTTGSDGVDSRQSNSVFNRKINTADKPRRKSRHSIHSFINKSTTVETWQDLLNVQRQEDSKSPVCAKNLRAHNRLAGATVTTPQADGTPDTDRDGKDEPTLQQTLIAMHHHQALPGPEFPATAAAREAERLKRIPIWQQVAGERTVYRKKNEQQDPETCIIRMRKNLNRLKATVEKEINAELEKLVREREANVRMKFGTLKPGQCCALFEQQKVRIQQVRDELIKEHIKNWSVRPSTWYEELTGKSHQHVFLNNNPGIQHLAEKLKVYAHNDNKTIPLAKAKLCLLMMSLPMYEICQIHVQMAIKFIFEQILLGSDAQFFEWMEQRKIPYILIVDPSAAANANKEDVEDGRPWTAGSIRSAQRSVVTPRSAQICDKIQIMI